MAQIKVKVGDLVRFYRPDPGVFPSIGSRVIGVVTEVDVYNAKHYGWVEVMIEGLRYISRLNCLAHVKIGKWIPWKGGNCPIPAGTPYQVHLHNGFKSDTGIAPEYLRWEHIPDRGDIVAFRIMEGR